MSFLSRCVSAKRYSLQKNIEADDFKIPPLVLQPLVENAIRHGLLHKKQGGTVILHTWAENGDSIMMTVWGLTWQMHRGRNLSE